MTDASPAHAADSVVSVQDLAAGKAGEPAFSGLDFDLAPASFTALAGPNGCGKTTLFETLLGLVPPIAGHVRVLGRTPQEARRGVAYVPQGTRLTHDGQFSGREFVAAAYASHRWGPTWRWRDAARAVNAALALVDGQALADRRLNSLSGGQRQRLMIAQALVNSPRLLFMDEPLAQLDPGAQAQVVALAERLRQELGLAVLFSTHDVNPIADVADRVLYLAGGQGHIGAIDEVVTAAGLSRLYGVPMHVVRDRGRLFVMRDEAPGANCARLDCDCAPVDARQRKQA
ncbi:metal ABC transporter ATP-binding protein [Salinisphaera sp. RV14]|uniref:metal ABC transporter ATP-binding protein n=1 Tax=unclassified Salinisphaera TaxID=2649847 RepID=UPI003F858277